MNSFAPEIIEKIGYYVYVFVDPFTDTVFYIGKGKDNRCFSHLNSLDESEKSKHIIEIKNKGKEPKIEILALGGSITAGGYFEEFARRLRQLSHLDVTVYNHGHGATEITYTIFCVDIEKYEPDLVMIDFAVNDDVAVNGNYVLFYVTK